MNFKIPFSGRAHLYTQDEVDEVSEVMKSAKTLTQGKYQEEFQKKLSSYLGVDQIYTLNNATAALELTAQLCQFKSDDEIIIPAHTYTATAYPFLKKGAKICWADINPKTRVVDTKTIEACITKKTKVILVVHLYGYCADMYSIMKLAKKYNLLVVEDVAQALGTKIDNKFAGTFGDFGIFSFHSHKNISTLGEGGALFVKDPKMSNIIPMLRHNGHCLFNYEREHYWIPAMGNLDFPMLNDQFLWPNNFCLGEVECALGIKLIDRLDVINNDKRLRALRFIDAMKGFSQLEFHRVSTQQHNYHLLVAKMTDGNRNIFIEKMAIAGVQCVVQYYPLYRYDLYKKAGYGEAYCPVTDHFFDNMVSFPFQHALTDGEFLEMIKITKNVLSSI